MKKKPTRLQEQLEVLAGALEMARAIAKEASEEALKDSLVEDRFGRHTRYIAYQIERDLSAVDELADMLQYHYEGK